MPGRRRLRLALALAALAAGPAAAGESLSREARWLADYLRIDTSNPPGNEAAAAAYLSALLGDAGLASERHVTASGRVSLAARLAATVPGAPTVVLLHHLDVVPAGEGWSVDPFAAEVHEGFLYGRGAIDSKSLGVAHLAALLDAARLPERRRSLLYLAVADEENGGGEGMAWLVERRPELLAGVEAALGEGGLNRTVLGRTFYWGIEVAQKRAYWLELEAGGRAGHGSSLNPESAAHELVRALERVLARPPVWKLQPPVAEFFRALARTDPALRSGRARAEEAVVAGGPARWVPPGYWGLLLDTVQVTNLAAGERPNVVPPRARAGLDVRLLPETDAEAFLAELGATLGERVAVEVRLATPPAPSSPVGNATWRALEAALGDEAPLVPALIPGITDARFFRQRGIPAYGVSPFALEGLLVRRVHGFDEGIPLDVFDRGVERMRRIVRALVAP